MRKKILVLFIFLCCLMIFGCKKESSIQEITSNEIFLTVEEINIEVDERYNVQVMLKDEFAFATITFQSNNPTIFTIENENEIVGKKAG